MGDAARKAQLQDRLDASNWEKRWADAATQRLQNAAKGEWSPWQTMKMAAYSIPLRANESGGYGGFDGAVSNQTAEREAAFEEAMKFADERARARAQVEAAIASGKETPQAVAKGEKFLAQEPQLAPSWSKMYRGSMGSVGRR